MSVAAADLASQPCKSVLRTAIALVDSGCGYQTTILVFNKGAEVSLITSSLARMINASFKPRTLQTDDASKAIDGREPKRLAVSWTQHVSRLHYYLRLHAVAISSDISKIF